MNGSLSAERRRKTILSVVLAFICILYILPVLAVVVNSFKLNTYVKTETFALPTAESFAALANEYSQDPGSNTNGGLYEGVTEGQMVAAFNDWCFDAERKEGDTGIVRTEYGYHVMYFCGSHLLWEQYAKEDYARTKANETANEIVAASPLTVKYDAILLANAELT